MCVCVRTVCVRDFHFPRATDRAKERAQKCDDFLQIVVCCDNDKCTGGGSVMTSGSSG